MKARFIVTLLGAAALWGLWWGNSTWSVLHPAFPMREVETKNYAVSYPAHWEPVDPSDPRLGDKELTFSSRADPSAPPWDRRRQRMTLRDEGTGHASLEDFVQELRRDEERSSAVQTWRLSNGVVAQTWVETAAMIDIPARIRWAAFQGRDGRFYSAGFLLPSDWKTRLRYERVFRDILGSMRFNRR